MTRLRDATGSALVEFTVLAVLLLVPLSYLVTATFSVQRAAFAVTAATREAGRAFVTSDSGADPQSRAEAAASLAMRDHGLHLVPGSLRITCESSECRTPGAHVFVTLDFVVGLPLVPGIFGGQPPGVQVRARHTETVDTFRAVP